MTMANEKNATKKHVKNCRSVGESMQSFYFYKFRLQIK